jgi:predicted permease
MSVIELVLPDFLVIALGWALLHKFGFSSKFFHDAEQLVYYVLFPALLFHSLTQTPLSLDSASALLLATLLLMGFGIAAAWLAVPVLKPDPIAHASTAQCAYRFNTYIGLSIAFGMGGAAGQTIMAVIVGFAVPIGNIAAVHGLARQNGGKVFKEIARNPFIIATVLGLAVNIAGFTIPGPLNVTLGRLGACAIAVGLLCVGATLSLEVSSKSASLISWMIGIRLVATPIAAIGIGQVLQLPTLDQAILLLFGALPSTSSAHILAAKMGGDGRLAAAVMSLSTLFAAATIPLWLLMPGIQP